MKQYLFMSRLLCRDECNLDIIIKPVLKKISRYAREKDVEVMIETTPVPEFGDGTAESELYRGVLLSRLRNPFYLSSLWGFEELRNLGFGICLDVCHSHTIYFLKDMNDSEGFLHQKVFAFTAH